MCIRKPFQKPFFPNILWTFEKFVFFSLFKSPGVKSYKCHHAKLFKPNFLNMLFNQNQVPNQNIINDLTISKSI